MVTRKTNTTDRGARSRSKASEETADLARGADGLSEMFDAQQDAMHGVMKAQMEAVNTMINATATSWKVMADMWTAALPKGRKDD